MILFINLNRKKIVASYVGVLQKVYKFTCTHLHPKNDKFIGHRKDCCDIVFAQTVNSVTALKLGCFSLKTTSLTAKMPLVTAGSITRRRMSVTIAREHIKL